MVACQQKELVFDTLPTLWVGSLPSQSVSILLHGNEAQLLWNFKNFLSKIKVA